MSPPCESCGAAEGELHGDGCAIRRAREALARLNQALDPPPEHAWAKELVCEWARKTDDVATLQAWFDACRARLARLGAARRGIPLEPGADIYANGTVYVIERVEEENEIVDVTMPSDAHREFALGRERVVVYLRRTGP